MGLIADVVDVVQTRHVTDPGGGFLDLPMIGNQAGGGTLTVSGWVLDRGSPVVAVEIEHDGATVARTLSLHERPDIATAYAGQPGCDRAGFRLEVAGVWGETRDLRVLAVLADRSRSEVAAIKVRASPGEETAALVSVVIPCYGQSHYLPTAIASVLSQTHANVEVVVIDDGSYDNVAAVVAQYPGVRLVQQGNRGLAGARNTGIRESTGQFLVFLDADDLLSPDALEVGIERFASHPECQLVMGRFRCVDWDGQLQWWTPKARPTSDDHYLSLLSGDYAGPPAICMYRRQVLDEVGGFDEAVPAAADYDLSLRVARSYPIHFHDSQVLDYRQGAYNMSNDGRLMFDNVMRVAHRQRRDGRGRKDLRVAYDKGVEYWRELYAARALEQIDAALATRDWRGSLGGMASLGRHDPKRLPDVLGRVRRHNRLRRATTRMAK